MANQRILGVWKVTLRLGDFLKKNELNNSELYKWFEVEEEDLTIPENLEAYEKDLKINLDGAIENGSAEVAVEPLQEFPESMCKTLDEIAEDNEYWIN